MKNEVDTRIGKIINKKYKIIKKLGKGPFFEVYQSEYSGDYFAIKFGKSKYVQNIYEILAGFDCPNIPFIKEIFSSNNDSYIVTQLFGKDLSKLMKQMSKFSIKTTAMIGYQIIKVLEKIHNSGIIHRNLGAENIVIGYGDLKKKIFLIDYSLAKKFKDTYGNLIVMNNDDKFCGIENFASINSLKGRTQSKRDDLESLGYILVYFLKGKLPWTIKKNMTKEDLKELAKIKQSITPNKLCDDLPKQMIKYIEYCRNLEYEDIPNYEMLKNLFSNMISKNNEVFDYVYDWSEKKNNNDINNNVNNNINNSSLIYKENEDLKAQLLKKDNIINELNEKIKKIGNINSIEMIETIEKQQKEIDSLKSAIQISSNNVIAVHFVSPDSSINFCFTCKLTDIFADVEKKLIQKFPKLEEVNCGYLVNGINVKRYKNLLENQIKEDGTKIIIIYNQ